MSPLLVTLFFTAGATTWIYTKLQKYSGNNTKQAVIGAGVAGFFIFIIFYFISSSVIK